ncbi:unnamed protein product, partial [Meganyctiphanes norvegica]
MPYLLCPICLDKYNSNIYEPVYFSNCSHHYCGACHMKIDPKSCPVCALNYDHVFLEQSSSLYQVANAVKMNTSRKISPNNTNINEGNQGVTTSFHGSSDSLPSVNRVPYTIPIHQIPNPVVEKEIVDKKKYIKSLLPIPKHPSTILSLDDWKYASPLFRAPLPDIPNKENHPAIIQSVSFLEPKNDSQTSVTNVKVAAATPVKKSSKLPE